MREVLHQGEGLVIALVVDDEKAIVEVESEASGPDLSVADEVVIVVDGEPQPLEADGPRRVQVVLGEAATFENSSMSLLVRVHEFFEGWEFYADEA